MKTFGRDDGPASARVLLAVAALAPLAALMSCAIGVGVPDHEIVGNGYSNELFYSEAPPAPLGEVNVEVAPGPDYVWGGGYWTRHQDRWNWVSGRWAPRPRADVVWEDGRWDPHPSGFVRVPGRWREGEKRH